MSDTASRARGRDTSKDEKKKTLVPNLSTSLGDLAFFMTSAFRIAAKSNLATWPIQSRWQSTAQKNLGI